MQDLANPLLILLVALGGALGGLARFHVSGAVDRRLRAAFPAGTLAVNVTGSLAIGAIAGVLRDEAGLIGATDLWALVVVGALGSYTTVSSFSLQTLDLARGGRTGLALLNVAVSVLLCIGAAAVGMAATRLMAG
jgi:CrcB protein